MQGGFEAGGGIRLELRPDATRVVVPSGLGTTLNASAILKVMPQSPLRLIGSADSTRLELTAMEIGLAVRGPATGPEYSADLLASTALLVIDTPQGSGSEQRIKLASGIEWSSQAGLGLKLGSSASALRFDGLLISWESLLWRMNHTTLDISATNLRIQTDLLPDLALAVDLGISVTDGALADTSFFRLREPSVAQLPLKDFHLDNQCLALTVCETNLNRWLQLFSADLADRSTPGETLLTLQIIFGQEIRLDWDIGSAPRTYSLPGVDITIPAGSRFTLALTSAEGRTFNRLALALTLPRGADLTAGSTFAWGRSGERELQNDPEHDRKLPIMQLVLQPLKRSDPNDRSLSLLLLELPFDGTGAPRFLRQLPSLPSPSTHPCAPLDLGVAFGLRADDWLGWLTLNLDQFKLPFLQNDQAGKEQLLQLTLPKPNTFELNFGENKVQIPVDATLNLASLSFQTKLIFAFNWETFGLEVNHDEGIQLISEKETLEGGPFLNLNWSFKGKQIKEGQHAGKYHFLTLVTKNYNYEIQQAPGAEFTVSYDGISEEPISFIITGLVIRSAGLSLEARVGEAPVQLKGIDTTFRFSNSGFVMQDSRIQEFTLAGTGALPPALVGDSSVDIFLRFGERNGGLTLLEGGAALRTNKPLQCPGTRFEFSISKIGLRFVLEEQFHLYFTLTGSAKFRLADSDDAEGLLALLPTITIEMVDCPLAGDIRVLAKHVRFLITLPKPLSFSLLGCFAFELRGFGFLPQAEMFGGDGAMWLSGQVKFADGPGDAKNNDTDYHSLYIGLPEPGSILPRIHFDQIAVDLKIADAFQLYAMVKYEDTPTARGFSGEGLLRVAGLPKFEAAFSFLRVRSTETNTWVRAWFIYAQVSELSLMLPVVQIYIREIGFGLGYRYTLSMLKAVDQERDVRKLLKSLDELAKSQGELAKLSSWAVDIDGPGDPRFTLVLRAMISQTSASRPTALDRPAEKRLACTFLFDAVLAFRSDLTFLITARGWINTNYVDYVDNVDGLRKRPFFFAYILLSAPQKRFLARMGNTPGGYIGNHPPLPEFVKTALAGARFRATLLIEPGLFHLDLGWPNQLGWSGKIGPVEVNITGGFIFRISRQDLVIGVSYMARGTIEIEGGVSIGIAGVRVYARADLAYGMRYIGVLSFDDPAGRSLFYGAVGLELRIQFSIEFWLELLIKTIRKRFSFSIVFTAALEFGLEALAPGVRGQGTLALKVCGRSFRVTIKIAVNESVVTAALKRTQEYLKLGLDADDTGGPPEPVPGTGQMTVAAGERAAGRALRFGARWLRAPAPANLALLGTLNIAAPHYSAFVVRKAHTSHDGWRYFVMFPRSTPAPTDAADGGSWHGFLPLPPHEPADAVDDFMLQPDTLNGSFTLEHVHIDGETVTWKPPDADGAFRWRANWEAQSPLDVGDDAQAMQNNTIRTYVASAFVETDGVLHDPDDPSALAQEQLEDERVYHPSASDFEAAVRGAFEQFQGAPFFKHDPDLAYDKALDNAFQPNTTIYASSGTLSDDEAAHADAQNSAVGAQQHADQLRGMIVYDIVADLRAYAEAASAEQRDTIARRSLAFQMGLVFRFKGTGEPAWLGTGDGATVARPEIRQRTPDGTLGEPRHVWVFNPPQTSFFDHPPTFSRVRHYSNASTIAIAWDLSWDLAPTGCADEQADPEHHLAYYRVLRRSLDSSENDVIYTVKSAQVLHRTSDDTLQLLKPRFQVVDHFTRETPAEQDALPVEGRSYLYSITPIDNAGKPGRPLTLVATRFPDRPPHVPTDARLRVSYQLAETKQDDVQSSYLQPPELLVPSGVGVEWSEPSLGRDESRVAIKSYRLIFRRSAALPIGSYGLDSTTQRSAPTLIGSAVARPLPNDVKIDLPDPSNNGDLWQAVLDVKTLRQAGVMPPDPHPRWRPDSWDVFIQTIGINNVPSALAPVQLVLEATRASAPELRAVERQPAELEWLPETLDLPLLPPEDQRATLGDAYFPMPVLNKLAGGEMVAFFDGNVDNVAYRRHPNGIRCVRVRWNQGPSAQPDYPIDLTAGFFLLELDIDAFTTTTFTHPRKLAEALRTLQEVRMVPDGDLPFLPDDTLSAIEWEAWYPSTMQRRVDEPSQRAPGSQIPYTPWYSWRDSVLVWPSPDVEGEPGWRASDLHPFLQRLIDHLDGVLFRAPASPDDFTQLDAGRLPNLPFAANFVPLTQAASVHTVSPGFEWRIDDANNTTKLYQFRDQVVLAQRLRVVRSKTGVIVSVASPYVVDRQELVPAQQGDFAGLLAAIPPKGDPYGWGVLQLFGLSTTLALREAGNAQPILGQDLLAALKQAIDACFALPRFTQFKQHLFIELLFQPTRSIELQSMRAEASALLANVQISLRPTILQQRTYARISVSGQAGTVVTLAFRLIYDQTLELINLRERSSGQQSIQGAFGIGTVDVPIPPSGRADLIIRAGSATGQADTPFVPQLGFPIDKHVTLDAPLDQFFLIDQPITQSYVFLQAKLLTQPEAGAAQVQQLVTDLRNKGVTVAVTHLTYPQVFTPTDELSADFDIPQTALATAFSTGAGHAGQQWLRFKRYADAVFTSAQTPISVPTALSDIQRILPDFLTWSQRFFDAAGTLNAQQGNMPAPVGQYGAGPWLATAYPRAGTPAYTTPDAGGRLTYNHLLQDKWAHTFRYYLKPYSRYERLMSALHDALTPPDAPRREPPLVAEPIPNTGGLDVVVERTEVLAEPLVLFSGRLDEAGGPESPAPPGRTWEVIVAQHPEQALSERNQTLRRRLAFRQIAFTLLRRFAESEWLEWLAQHQPEGVTLTYRYVEAITQPIPHEYPALPDHLDLRQLRDDESSLDETTRETRAAARRSLDLPLRLGRFQQGALVLQWEALPFYYEHCLHLIAQADSKVSPVRDLAHREFEYRTPVPSASAAGALVPWPSDAPFQPAKPVDLRGRQIRILLRRFWDSLPAAAQQQWSSEEPGAAPYTDQRTFASLPDHQVVYQVVERFGGNVEVQAELFFGPDPATSPDQEPTFAYHRRQLGTRVLAGDPQFEALQDARGDYRLTLSLSQFAELTLSQAYSLPDNMPALSFREHVLRVGGVLTPQAYGALLALITSAEDRTVIETFYQLWSSREAVSEQRSLEDPPDDLPQPARDTLTSLFKHQLIAFEPARELTLVWSGPLLESDQEALQAWARDYDEEFKAALSRLVSSARSAQNKLQVVEPVLLAPGKQPSVVPPQLSFTADADGTISAVTWTGTITAAQRADVLNLTDDPDVRAALSRLSAAAQIAQDALVARDVAVRGLDQPPPIAPDLKPLFDRLVITIEREAHTATHLTWNGTLYDDEKTLIEPVLHEWAQIAVFRDALDRLFGGLDTRTVVQAGRVRPDQSDLPDSLETSLLLGDDTLRWQGDPPTPEQQQAAREIVADTSFTDAIQALLTQLQNSDGQSVPLDLADDASPPPVPDVLVGQLSVEGTPGQRTLHWRGPVPTTAQQHALDALRSDPVLGSSVVDLLAKIDVLRVLALPAPPAPLEQAEGAELIALRERLLIKTEAGVTTLTWVGRIKSVEEAQRLASLQAFLAASADYRGLAPALQRIVAALAEPLIVRLDLPLRPEQADVPEPFRDRLLLGRAVIRYQGLMTFEEGQALTWLYADPPDDQDAPTELTPALQTANTRSIQRLYAASLNKGMQGRELKIRARRANALPSQMRAFGIEPLIPSAPQQESPA
ncbi:MAG TPA: hypothetical protein VGD69_05580 [Herpetosiphonaceae bacterium]